MENFNLNDFVMDFEFDFQHDFTHGENQVIDEILTNQMQSDSMFNGMRENPPAFYDYFCNDSVTVNGFGAAEQMVSIENGVHQMSFDHAAFSASASCEAQATHQNNDDDDVIDFDWTTFLDKSPRPAETENEPSRIAQQNTTLQDNLHGSPNVINENGFIYQELKTLDIPSIYGDLGQTFGLDDLKKLDKCLDYASLTKAKHSIQQQQQDEIDDKTMFDQDNSSLAKKKVFLMPLHLDPMSTESLHKVAAKLKKHPLILNSMLNHCADSKNAEKIELPGQPKQVKQKSDRYLSVREHLERIASMEITLPMIKRRTERQQRKKIFQIDNNKVPIEYAVEVILTDFNTYKILINNGTEAEKRFKAKKEMPNAKTTKSHENIEVVEKSKRGRRSSKKVISH